MLLRCVAEVAGEQFSEYYASFMPGIKSILRTATGENQAILRGKAMECVGLMGDAVGASTFAADAGDIMSILIGSMVRNIFFSLCLFDMRMRIMI